MLENRNEIVTYCEYRHHDSPIYSLRKIPVSSKIAKSKHAPVICGDLQNKKRKAMFNCIIEEATN